MSDGSVQTSDVPRAKRFGRARRLRRALIALAALAVLGLLAAGGYLGVRLVQAKRTGPLDRLVIIGESRLEDGTTVAGVVAVVDRNRKVESFDSSAEVVIPGTSYATLADALAMGGADEVVCAALETAQVPDDTGWLLLRSDEWPGLVDQAGGIAVTVPEATTVFDGEQLVRFRQGQANLTGVQSFALLLGASSFEATGAAGAVRQEVAARVAGVVLDHPDDVAPLLDADHTGSGDAAKRVREFLGVR